MLKTLVEKIVREQMEALQIRTSKEKFKKSQKNLWKESLLLEDDTTEPIKNEPDATPPDTSNDSTLDSNTSDLESPEDSSLDSPDSLTPGNDPASTGEGEDELDMGDMGDIGGGMDSGLGSGFGGGGFGGGGFGGGGGGDFGSGLDDMGNSGDTEPVSDNPEDHPEDPHEDLLQTAEKIAAVTNDSQKVLKAIKSIIQNRFSDPLEAADTIQALYDNENPIIKDASRRLAFYLLGK